MKQRAQQGVALVVTLIMLAVITVVVVAFLAVTQRNRALVGSASNFTEARFLSDAARNRAQSEIISRMIARTNLNAFEMLVSTNYQRLAGFDPGVSSVTNVAYTYDYVYQPQFGTPLSYDDLMLNMVNLYYDPRPPVYVLTNAAAPFNRDFRFYLDLNRNGAFDFTGEQTIIDQFGNRDFTNRFGMISNYYIGDPQWIGVLEKPDQRHSSSNRFIGRYAYVVVPEGLTLDLNTMHNHTRFNPEPIPPGGDGFMRNMGVGTWEMNLAGFLVGLNTNFWPAPGQTGTGADYFYQINNLNAPNSGLSFVDATTLLFYRYRSNPLNPATASHGSLRNFRTLFGNAATPFRVDLIDGYGDGPFLLGENLARPEDPQDPTDSVVWSGAPSPTQYFSQDDLFDPNKVGVDFLSRLDGATRGIGSYNGGTYYRLLSQLGTASSPEPDSFTPGSGISSVSGGRYLPEEKMNLNYDNRDLRATGGPKLAATDVVPWEPLAFFTNAADRLLRSQQFVGSDGRTICLTNIMIWPTNNYDSAVHRCLQVAANLFDASTNYWARSLPGPDYPSVFRPMLRREEVPGVITNIYIGGYMLQPDIANNTNFVSRGNYLDLNQPGAVSSVPTAPTTNQRLPFGVPLVIGAKKGFPNFNELAVRTEVQVQRNLLLTRPRGAAFPSQTNQFYIMSISNVFGIEGWNSYQADYPRDLQLAVEVDFVSTMQNYTNDVIYPYTFINPLLSEQTYSNSMTLPAGNWTGKAFQLPIMTNNVFLTNSVWSTVFPYFRPVSSNAIPAGLQPDVGFPVPEWVLNITNRVRYLLTENGRILDYVNMDGLTRRMDIVRELQGQTDSELLPNTGGGGAGEIWNMTRQNGTTSPFDAPIGVGYQMRVGTGEQSASSGVWNFLPGVNDKDKAIDAFRIFNGLQPIRYQPNQLPPIGTQMQAPFSPGRKLVMDVKYEVNDPLVHYTVLDVDDPARSSTNTVERYPMATKFPDKPQSMGVINTRYAPWASQPDLPITQNPVFVDPLITSSDAWSFPTNKFPNLGWMGRVHRGTPWQTIYLKAVGTLRTDTIPPVYESQMGGWALERGNALTSPDRDWRFLDLFTTALAASATRGQLSVNQSGEAAWAAVLSGVWTMTNDLAAASPSADVSGSMPHLIQPGSPEFYSIVDGINFMRTNQFGGYFRNKGEVLSAPQLSLQSPYLDRSVAEVRQAISDVAMERIPQQIMSLLRIGEPRVVVYAFGQSLEPAQNSLVQDPNYYQICTNYQITGEFATRSVIRFEGSVTNLNAVVEETRVLPPE